MSWLPSHSLLERASLGTWGLLAPAFLLASALVLGPALSGPFVSDDGPYLVDNPAVHSLSPANLWELVDPRGDVAIRVMNYQPVTNLLHALAWRAFGAETTGHHWLNVVLHTAASLLLVALFARSGIAGPTAILGGLLFLVHPANVEAVAWITQLKSNAALVLSLAALLAFPGRPALATFGFALALLAKPTAAFALPVAGLFQWTRGERIAWRWLVLWTLVLLAFAAAELRAYQLSAMGEGRDYETLAELVRTVAAIAMRYGVMAATTLGLSAFHEPPPVRSWLDPWWLGGLGLMLLLGWRGVATLAARRDEGVYWAWAAISFAPVCQIFPFLYPIADRYLYFILPGLIGGVLLFGQAQASRAAARVAPQTLRIAALAALALCVGGFGARAAERARIWRIPGLTLRDAASHYPEGASAHVQEVLGAAQRGDAQAVANALEPVARHSFARFVALLSTSQLAPVRHAPPVEDAVGRLAGEWLAGRQGREAHTQTRLKARADAHLLRGERQEAEGALERAIAAGGHLDRALRARLDALRAGAL